MTTSLHRPNVRRLTFIALACAALAACGGADSAADELAFDAGLVDDGIDSQMSEKRLSDSTAPVVSIAAPSTSGTWNTSLASTALSGKATDNRRIARVTWANDRGGSGRATLSGTYTQANWSVPAVTLVTGTNNLTITAVDGWGNRTSSRLVVSVAAPSTSTGTTTGTTTDTSGGSSTGTTTGSTTGTTTGSTTGSTTGTTTGTTTGSTTGTTTGTTTFAPVTGTALIGIPSAGTYPAKGVAMTDPATGLQITRVADKSELTGDYGGTQSQLSAIVYSRYTPTNTTGEFVLVHGDNSTSAWLYRVSTNTKVAVLKFNPELGTASRSLGEVNELRWDYSGQFPYRLYFTGRSLGSGGKAIAGENIGMSFYYVDIDPTTGTQSKPTLIRDFSKDFPTFSGGEIMNDVEGDSSIDSRYWAWQVMNTSLSTGYRPYAIFSYDKSTNTVMGSIQRSCTGSLVPCVAVNTPATSAPYLSRPNMVEMSPLGTRVHVNWGRTYAGNRDADTNTIADGPKAFLPNFSDPIRIAADETHSGWAWGVNGEELFVSQNNRNDYIEAVDIRNATTAKCTVISGNSYTCGTKVLAYSTLDGGTWSLGMHFGKFYDRSKKGWIYMNTYDTSNSTWGKNQNLLVAVNDVTVSATSVIRLGHTYNAYYDYRSEGSGALDFKGEAVWATANWGFKDGRGDAFKLQLPANWYSKVAR